MRRGPITIHNIQGMVPHTQSGGHMFGSRRINMVGVELDGRDSLADVCRNHDGNGKRGGTPLPVLNARIHKYIIARDVKHAPRFLEHDDVRLRFREEHVLH